MNKWQIVVAKEAQPFFLELIQAIKFQLIQQGYSVRVDNNFQPYFYNHIFVIAPHAIDIPEKINCEKLIALQTEQLPQGFANNYTKNNWTNLQQKLIKFSYIFDLYEGNIFFLKKNGFLNSHLFSLGFDSHFLFKVQNFPEVYDICFLGCLSDRRKKLIDRLSKKFKICPTHQAFGTAREQFYLQSRICLNIHVEDSDFFERLRVEHLLINKKFVISENSLYHSPLIPEHHLIFRDYNQIEDSISYYLSNPNERLLIAETAQQFFKNEYHFSFNFKKVLDIIINE